MKILHCDSCHTEVNDYSHWYSGEQPRNMYELKCVHESGSKDTYDGMIICHECIAKLLHKAEGSGMTYGDIYNEFCKKFPNAEIEDYRPAVELHIPQLARAIPDAIIVWLKDGSKVIYIAESEDK